MCRCILFSLTQHLANAICPEKQDFFESNKKLQKFSLIAIAYSKKLVSPHQKLTHVESLFAKGSSPQGVENAFRRIRPWHTHKSEYSPPSC